MRSGELGGRSTPCRDCRLNGTGINIPAEAVHLLGPRHEPHERVCQVIRQEAKTCVAEYSEFIQPGVIDEAIEASRASSQ